MLTQPAVRILGDVHSADPRPSLRHTVRAVANWINLSTPLGLVIARVGGAEVRRGPDRLWIADDYRWAGPKAGAFTIGSVVVVPNATLSELLGRHQRLLVHERAHADQWAICLGLPFLPLYAAATAWSQLRTGTNHGANVFETRAGLNAGGYPHVPARPPRMGARWRGGLSER